MNMRHKWITDRIGNKQCSICGSRIRATIEFNSGKHKYIEKDSYGTPHAVSHYPRCLKQLS